MKGVHGRLGRLAQQAAEYKELGGRVWAPRVAAWVCAAHHLEHALREGPGPLLLLDLQARPPVDVIEDLVKCLCLYAKPKSLLCEATIDIADGWTKLTRSSQLSSSEVWQMHVLQRRGRLTKLGIACKEASKQG